MQRTFYCYWINGASHHSQLSTPIFPWGHWVLGSLTVHLHFLLNKLWSGKFATEFGERVTSESAVVFCSKLSCDWNTRLSWSTYAFFKHFSCSTVIPNIGVIIHSKDTQEALPCEGILALLQAASYTSWLCDATREMKGLFWKGGSFR